MGTPAAVISDRQYKVPKIAKVSPSVELIKAVIIDGQIYHTIPEAARLIGISHITLFRWVKGTSPAPIEIEALHDTRSGYYYVKSKTVSDIRDKRFRKI